MPPPRSLLLAALRLLLVAAAMILAPSCLPGAGEGDSGEAVDAPFPDPQVLAYDRATGAFEPALLADLAPPAELLHDGQLWRLTADRPVLVGPAHPAELAEADATYDAARPARAPAAPSGSWSPPRPARSSSTAGCATSCPGPPSPSRDGSTTRAARPRLG